VVLWPIVALIQTSLQNITPFGISIGSAGTRNFTKLFGDPNLPGILVRTVVWVVAVVALTMLISLALAQLFNQRFPGRRVTRWALIAPWAASVMMTALIFRWMLQPDNGAINIFLHQLGIVSSFDSNESSWLGRPDSALAWMIGVAVFVSLPFTTYTLLAGHQSIPGELYEAAELEGAGVLRRIWHVTIPQTRLILSLLLMLQIVATMQVFLEPFILSGGGPEGKTTTVVYLIYEYAFHFNNYGSAAALGLILLVVLAIFGGAYLFISSRAEKA
jgi:multiple sugar transport system permease protein